jgi:hypothetical protein
MNVKGVKDLCLKNRYHARHLMIDFENKKVPGKWDSHQNMYNLIHGKIIPKDAYVYIALAKFFDVDIYDILYRYTSVKDSIEVSFSSSPSEEEDIW